MKKRLLTLILTIVSILMCIFGLSACQDDGDSDDSSTIIGGDINCEHLWSDWTEEQEATCKTTGLQSRICTLCERKEEKIIEKTAHKYNSENACEYCGVELAYTSGLDYERLGYSSSSYYYVVKGIGTATETDIVIPAQHAGYPVKAVASEAFYGNDRITSIFAPSTITEVGTNAFYYCEKLHTITLEGVNKIGSQAFKKCSKLEKISIKSAKEIGTESFSDCVKLKDVALSENTILIGQNAFLNTGYYNASDNWEGKALYIGKHLICVKEDYPNSSFAIKNGTLTIASYAFNNISKIEIVNFPDNEIRIGSYAFKGCSNWKEFEITDKMTLVDYALSGSSLTKLVAPAKYVIESITETTNSYNVDIGIPSTLKTLIITGSYSANKKLSFSDFKQLEHLEHNFRHTGYGGLDLSEAYKDLKNLKTLTMPGCTNSGYGIHIGKFFSSTYYNGSVPVTTYVNSKKYTYYFPASLKEMTIDGGYVNESMFYNCDNFQSITIKNLLDYGDEYNIGNDALTNVMCENLSIDNSVSKISDIYLYKDFEISNGVKNLHYLGTLQDWISTERERLYVDNIYINGQKVEGELVLPDGMTEIPERAFCEFSGLTNIIIPDSVTKIGADAFLGTEFYNNDENWENGVLYCGKYLIKSKEEDLGNTGIKEGTLVIADEAFKNSKNLPDEILFPDSLITIGDKAFSNTGLVKLTIGENVEHIGKGAFYSQQLTELKYYAINANTDIKVGDYDISGTPFGADDEVKLTIGHNVKNLPTGVFSHLLVKEVVFEGVSVCESIGDYAFYDCPWLTSIEIPNSVTTIGNCAFEGCPSLTSITIPSSIQTMGSPSYSVFGATYTYRGRPLTVYCEALEKPNDWSSSWNGGCPVVWNCKNNDVAEDGYIYTVIDGIRYSLKDGVASVVEQSKNIITANIPTTVSYKNKNYIVTSIKDGAFYGCGELLSVKIPNTIIKIESDTFNWCVSLKSVEIPDSVISIGEEAFRSCSSLTSIAIPNSVTSLGEYAFANCKLLSDITIGNGVSRIGDGVFYDCGSLVSIEIPDNVTYIGYNAFAQCISLTRVIMGNGVTSITNSTFNNCTSLDNITFNDTSTWYRTTSNSNWRDKTGGTQTSVTTPSTNATYFKSTYNNYYWYKL